MRPTAAGELSVSSLSGDTTEEQQGEKELLAVRGSDLRVERRPLEAKAAARLRLSVSLDSVAVFSFRSGCSFPPSFVRD